MERIVLACEALLAAVKGHIWVGFSGGMDSTVLLHALSRGTPDTADAGERLTAVHVDHGLSPASADWARHCERLAGDLGVGWRVEPLRLTAGANLEARARAARYRAFRALLDTDDVLVLAHHADDQLESVLLHLFQGRGLYGMPAERGLGAGRLVRPLLGLSRSSLTAYARAHELEWIEDPSNQDLRLDRNFLRHQVVPALTERFPELPRRLARVTESTSATAQALTEALSLSRNPLPLSVLDGLSRPVRQSVIRHWLVAQDAAAGVSDSALADFLDQLESSNDRQPSMNLGAGRLARYRRQLYLVGTPPVLDGTYAVSCPGTLTLPHGRLQVVAEDDAPDADAQADAQEGAAAALSTDVVLVSEPLHVTFVAALPGGSTLRVGGQDRKIRELMRAAGLPPWVRDSLPLLADASGVAAVPGIAVRDPLDTTPVRNVRIVWEPVPTGPPESDAR